MNKVKITIKSKQDSWFSNPSTFYKVDHDELASRGPYIQLAQAWLYLAPPNHYWDFNNTISVYQISPFNPNILESSKPFTTNPKFHFFIPDMNDEQYLKWDTYLTGLGYTLQPDIDEFQLMSIQSDEIIQSPIKYKCQRLALSDLEIAMQIEPGTNILHKTNKLTTWLQQGYYYVSFDSNNMPTCKIYCHAKSKQMAYIRAVETKIEYRRQQYARSLLLYVLQDLFALGFERVVLQVCEDGPAQLYLSVGFQIHGTAFECLYDPPK